MMARGRELWLKVLLACLLQLSWARSMMAHDVMPSDDLSDFPSPYRYNMNGTELSKRGFGSVGLVPLSTSLFALSPDEFSKTMFGGNLVNVNASNVGGLPAFTIPYISCDEPDVMTSINDAINSTEVQNNVLVAILYSETHNHCNISGRLAIASWLSLFTLFDVNKARQIAALQPDDDNLGIIQVSPDLSSLPPGTNERKGSPIPMIILYALTSMITVLLLVVIIGGAIKARRHPERYGPRAILRPRQSRARGIAMAMLETLPIVRFGDPDPKQGKTGEGERDLEMTATANKGSEEEKDSEPKPSSQQTAHLTAMGAAVSSRPATPRLITDEASTSSPVINPSNPNSPPPTAPETPTSAKEPTSDSLSCSICTEDFTLGEELRVLPCNHKFHPLCVDPWLLNVSGTCPLCRIDLRPTHQQQEEAFDGYEDELYAMITGRPPRERGPRSAPSNTSRPRSTIGGIMRRPRSILGVDLQSIIEASRDERIRILRRWREERRRQQQQPHPQSDSDSGTAATEAEVGSDGFTGTARHRPRPNAPTLAQRRSTRISQWVRGGFPALSSDTSRAETPRPRTWYAGAGDAAGASRSGSGHGVRLGPNPTRDQSESGRERQREYEAAPQLPPLSGVARTSTERERARSWYGDLTNTSIAGTASLAPAGTQNSESAGRRSLDAGAGPNSNTSEQ